MLRLFFFFYFQKNYEKCGSFKIKTETGVGWTGCSTQRKHCLFITAGLHTYLCWLGITCDTANKRETHPPNKRKHNSKLVAHRFTPFRTCPWTTFKIIKLKFLLPQWLCHSFWLSCYFLRFHRRERNSVYVCSTKCLKRYICIYSKTFWKQLKQKTSKTADIL